MYHFHDERSHVMISSSSRIGITTLFLSYSLSFSLVDTPSVWLLLRLSVFCFSPFLFLFLFSLEISFSLFHRSKTEWTLQDKTVNLQKKRVSQSQFNEQFIRNTRYFSFVNVEFESCTVSFSIYRNKNWTKSRTIR